MLNWTQRKGPEEIEGAEVDETAALKRAMKSRFVLAGAQSTLTHRRFQVGCSSDTALTDFLCVQ